MLYGPTGLRRQITISLNVYFNTAYAFGLVMGSVGAPQGIDVFSTVVMTSEGTMRAVMPPSIGANPKDYFQPEADIAALLPQSHTPTSIACIDHDQRSVRNGVNRSPSR